MADEKKNDDAGIERHDIDRPNAVVSTTTETPSKADESSQPGPYAGEGAPALNDPPVRTNRPDVPIAAALADGAGAHTPPDASEVGPDGRAVYDEVAASEAGEGETLTADEADPNARANPNEPDATDAAREKARELGVDLGSLKGTGADGRITVGDVEGASSQ